MGLLSRFKPNNPNNLPAGNAPGDAIASPDPEKFSGAYDDTPVKFLTVRSMAMGILVSMGGFIFGYDTGTY